MSKRQVWALAFLCISSLFAFSQQQPKRSPVRDWVFATAETATQLNALTPHPSTGLTKAICSNGLKVTAIHRTTNANRFETADSVVPGDHCLLVDSASEAKIFLWGDEENTITRRTSCIKGFPEQAEALAGRKVSSCYWLGGTGTGQIELVAYVSTSPHDNLAALLMDNQRTPPPDDTQRLSVLLPGGGRGWSEESFHPEQFHHLFTMARNEGRSDTDDIEFVAIEWRGPAGSDLILYRPHGSALVPILVNHDAPAQKLRAEE